MDRRAFLTGAGALGALLASGVTACDTGGSGRNLAAATDATAITEVFGDGMKLTAVALRFDRDIDTTTLTTSTFAVPNRTITRVYTNTDAAVSASPRRGPFVIVEMSPADPEAALWGSPQGGAPGPSPPGQPSAGGPPAAGQAGPAPTITPASAAVTQVGTVTAMDGATLPRAGAVTTGRVVNPIVDDFTQLQFHDPATSNTLAYNLFTPKTYDPAKRYPLVLFMHDASVVGAPPVGPLVQGLGAVSWASPDDQSRHECFVVAPQYPTVVVDDTYQPTSLFDTTANLVRALGAQYSIDPTRRYATGQSMGAMMTIGMNVRHPDLFAASYVVAGQWPTDQTEPLAQKHLWITVSQGDTKAYPGENAITALAERNGATVTRADWNGRSTPGQFATQVSAVAAANTMINYTTFQQGTVTAAGAAPAGGSEHMGTWQVAYGIPGIRDWIMQQHS